MRHAFNDKLLGEGFASRTIFVYGARNRFEAFRIEDHTPEQLMARERLILRLKELSLIFGQCVRTDEALEFLKHYFSIEHPKRRDKADPKLKHYLSRKNLHLQKLAMCIHYADSDDMVIGVKPFQEAVEIIDPIEDTMILCLNTRSNNFINDLQRDIFRYLQGGPKDFADIIVKFFDEGNQIQIMEAIEFLKTANKIKQDGVKYAKI
jgi:hypothetical protein